MSRVVIVVAVLKVKKRSGRTKTNPQADLRKEVAAEPAEVQCCAGFCQGPGSPRRHVRTTLVVQKTAFWNIHIQSL